MYSQTVTPIQLSSEQQNHTINQTCMSFHYSKTYHETSPSFKDHSSLEIPHFREQCSSLSRQFVIYIYY